MAAAFQATIKRYPELFRARAAIMLDVTLQRSLRFINTREMNRFAEAAAVPAAAIVACSQVLRPGHRVTLKGFDRLCGNHACSRSGVKLSACSGCDWASCVP